jgi:hypothetical protein
LSDCRRAQAFQQRQANTPEQTRKVLAQTTSSGLVTPRPGLRVTWM